MKLFVSLIVMFAFAFTAGSSISSQAKEKLKTPYAGQEKRQIKSLSEKDIDDLLNGRGWGFAKAAELNGMPGPAHIIELADKINLNDKQKADIQAMFRQMKSRAIQLGSLLVKRERELDQMFAQKLVTKKSLAAQLKEIGLVRSKLRQVHLETHLKTPDILTQHQIVTYNKLRGYSSGSKHQMQH